MFSKNKGWVRLHRKIEDSPLWFSESFTKAQAWVDLFLYANHKQAKIFIRGIEIEVKRGQLAWSEVTMSKRWKWSRKRVRNFLKYLEKEHQIVISQDRFVTTLITIINYDNHQKDTAEDTAEEQQKSSRGYINNNDKNVNNVKNDKKNTTLASIEKTTFDFSTSKFLNLNGKIEKYQEKYPGINVQSEVLKMEAWLMSNPKNRKTHYERFINNWLSRAQDKAPKHSEGETVDERHKRELEETKRRLGY